MFPELAQGTLRGYPVVSSVTVPNDLVFLVDTANFVLAMDPPEFLESAHTALHMDQDPATVAPIVAEDGTVAVPVKSVYQHYARALRMVMYIDWAELRAGSVVMINNVAW